MTFFRPLFGRKQSAPAPRPASRPAFTDAPVTLAGADARQDREIAWQRGFLAKVNAQMPAGTSGVAYAMLPWELWNGPHGQMLAVTCGLWPTQAWNMMLLAADPRSSAVLGLPEHPAGYPSGLLPKVERLLGELDANAATTVPKIIAISHSVGALCLGEEVFARHKQMFADTLGWPGSR